MPADNNMRRGNHFASGPAQTNGPKSGASPIGGQGFGSQAPDTTQEFMNAHRAARVNQSQHRTASHAQQPTVAAPKPAGSARRAQQAAEAQGHPAVDMHTAHVGAAVDDAIHHRGENGLIVPDMPGKTYESAHGQTFPAKSRMRELYTEGPPAARPSIKQRGETGCAGTRGALAQDPMPRRAPGPTCSKNSPGPRMRAGSGR